MTTDEARVASGFRWLPLVLLVAVALIVIAGVIGGRALVRGRSAPPPDQRMPASSTDSKRSH